MTIAKGQPWGEEIERPVDLPVAGSDAQLARFVAEHGTGPFGVSDGDLYRALGRPDPARRTARRLSVDVLHVTTDHGRFVVVSHAVARRSWWRGPIVVVANVSHVKASDAVPSAHPNDGRFETLEVEPSMPVRQRLQARRRLRTGTHLPHPALGLRHRTHTTFTFDPPIGCELDSVERGATGTMDVSIEADAFTLIV